MYKAEKAVIRHPDRTRRNDSMTTINVFSDRLYDEVVKLRRQLLHATTRTRIRRLVKSAENFRPAALLLADTKNEIRERAMRIFDTAAEMGMSYSSAIEVLGEISNRAIHWKSRSFAIDALFQYAISNGYWNSVRYLLSIKSSDIWQGISGIEKMVLKGNDIRPLLLDIMKNMPSCGNETRYDAVFIIRIAALKGQIDPRCIPHLLDVLIEESDASRLAYDILVSTYLSQF